MSHNVETMAYTNEVPWHGLGYKVDKAQSVDSMMKAAKINWKVDKQPIFLEDKTQIDDRFALVRSTDQRVLDLCGKDYTPHQNRELFKFFDEYVKAGDAYMETAGSLRNGQLVWGLANLNASFKLKGNDEVKGYLLVMAPHVVGKASIAKLTTVRVVCNNTLDIALKDSSSPAFKLIHRKEMSDDIIQQAKEQMGIARESLMSFKDTATQLQKLKLQLPEMVEVVSEIFSKSETTNELEEASFKVKQIIDCTQFAPGAQPDNAWGLLNGVTYWADHIASRTSDKRLANAWLGKTNKQKQKVLNRLMEMV